MKYIIFGESHGPAIGVALEGLPSGIALDMDFIASEMARRAPGQNAMTTARREKDAPEILSGVFEGKTTGTPLCAVISNTDTRSGDYAQLKALPRPGHADYSGGVRYGGLVVLNETMWGLGTSVMPTIMGHMEGSTEILAAYTVAGNVEKMCTVFSFGLAATAAVIIGREIGAGRTKNLKNVGLTMDTLAVMCGLVLCGLLLCFVRFVAPQWVFPLFKLSAGASSVATMMITVMACVMPLRNFNTVNIVGVLRGGGDVRAATLIDVGNLWLVAIPYAVVCGVLLRTSVFWVYLAFGVEQIGKFAVGVWRLRSGRWVRDLTVVG